MPQWYRPIRLDDVMTKVDIRSRGAYVAVRRSAVAKRRPLHKLLLCPKPRPGLNSRGRRSYKRKWVMNALELRRR